MTRRRPTPKRRRPRRKEFERALKSVMLDPSVLRLFAGEVKRGCGIRPKLREVRIFMRERLLTGPGGMTRANSRRRLPTRTSALATQPSFTLYGETKTCRDDTQVLVGVLKGLDARIRRFYERLAPRLEGTSRTYLSRDRERIYLPHNSETTRRAVKKLPRGWWIGTNSSTSRKNAQLQTIREVARLTKQQLNWRMGGQT